MKKTLIIFLVSILAISTIGFAANSLFKKSEKETAINYFKENKLEKYKYYSAIRFSGELKNDYEGEENLTIDWGDGKTKKAEFSGNTFKFEHLYLEKGEYDVFINLDGKKTKKVVKIEEAPIIFEDDNLRRSLYDRLRAFAQRNKEEGLTMEIKGLIYPSQAKYLEKVMNEFALEPLDNINSLKGIGHFTNLKKLDLSLSNNNNIKDISPLKNLKLLEVLKLPENKIKNIDIIKELSNLKELDLSENKIEKVDLKELSNLKELDLSENNIKKIDLGKINIERLNLNQNSGIKNIDFLTKLTKLKSVSLVGPSTGPDISTIKPLLLLKELKYLRVNVPKLDIYDLDSETGKIIKKLEERNVRINGI
jgi:uncharacterized protein YjbI with pentapeptide repeats